ncbi:MAG: NAD-dependent deacylase [Planctomycetota bacterium]
MSSEREVSIVVLTGAGISADSGLATFRDAGGLWEGHKVEDVATPEAWARNPALVWRFYQLRRAQLATVVPNAAHHALVDFERHCNERDIPFLLVTQNVDDLHDRAGSKRLLHMHGELTAFRCERCDTRVRELTSLDPERYLACPACANPRLRPDIVWFGEMPYHMDEIEQALSTCTHFLAIGTSGTVYPAAGFLDQARRSGAHTYVQALERPAGCSASDELILGPSALYLNGLLSRVAHELNCG